MGKVVVKKKPHKPGVFRGEAALFQPAPAVTVKLGTAYKKLVKKGQWIMVESTDTGCPSFGKTPARPPKKGRWTTDDHCIEIREEDPEEDYPGGYSLVVAKSWDHCDVVLDAELNEKVTLTDDCIVGQGFKIWILEQSVVKGLLGKIKTRRKRS